MKKTHLHVPSSIYLISKRISFSQKAQSAYLSHLSMHFIIFYSACFYFMLFRYLRSNGITWGKNI